MNRLVVRAVSSLALCSAFLSMAPPAQANAPVLEWTGVSVPGDNDLTVVSPSEVTGVAAGRNGVVYAIDGEYGRVYRSLEYALCWEDITGYLQRAGAILPATFVAVAPDNEGIVAVVTDGGTALYVSLDGGYEWEDVHLPALTGDVTALAVSGLYVHSGAEHRDIAVGTASWGDSLSNGQVWILRGGCVWAGWRNQEIRVDPLVIGADVSTLAFSPSYARDHTLIVVASTGPDVATYADSTRLVLGERNKSAGITDWTAFTGYPLEIIGAGEGGPGVSVHSSLALPSDFDSRDAGFRNLFVSVDRTPDFDDDVYRVVGDVIDFPYGRMDVDGGSDSDIWSIAYRGTRIAGVLLAGDREPVPTSLNVQVRRCENPFASSPVWDEADVPPTGPGHAVLAWAPNVSLAYSGTSSQPGAALDESAFSASSGGNLWRQMAIIDTALTLTDLAVAPDGSKLFLTTSNAWGPESVWHSFSDPLGLRWERLLTVDSTTDAVMVKLSADYANDGTVFVAAHNGNQLAYSFDRGNSWQWRWSTPELLLDLIVDDATALYAAIPGGRVMKSTNGGRNWEEPVETQLREVNMLARSSGGALFAGSDDGYVSYSTDGGGTWTAIEEPVGAGTVQVIPDVDFEDNDWIYAAASSADNGLWRWRVGRSVYWQQLDGEVTGLGDGQIIAGLLTGPEGTLYALGSEPVGTSTGGMTRWLCPACEPCVDHEYDHIIEDLPTGASFAADAAFTTSYPVGTLWGDDELNDVFAIDSVGQRIFMFTDTLCKRGPNLDSPADGASLDENTCDCNRDAVVAFDWEKFDSVNLYEVSFYHEAAPGLWLWRAYSDYDGFVASPSGDSTQFLSGIAYGWRVRTVSPILSPWSDMWRMYPRLLSASDLQPAPGATGVAAWPTFTWKGPAMADAYEFVLATDPDFEKIVVSFSGASALGVSAWACDRELSAGAHYFWKVRSMSGEACSPWVAGAFTTAAPPVPSPASGVSSLDLPAQQAHVNGYLIWAMLGLAAVLMTGLIVLVLRAARY